MKNSSDFLSVIYAAYPALKQLIGAIAHAGGQAYLVGGAVRDLFLEKPLKDLDIEVHKLSFAELEKSIKPHTGVLYAGKSFGVLKSTDYPIDFALPRTDSSGRHPQVAVDPHMGIEQAI